MQTNIAVDWKQIAKSFALAILWGFLAGALLDSHVHAAPQVSLATAAEPQGMVQRLVGAGRIRQQAQRIAKLYLQVGIGLNDSAGSRQLSGARQQIESSLAELSPRSTDARTRTALERVTRLWGELKQSSGMPYSGERAGIVNDQAENLTIAAGKLAMLIEQSADASTGRLLDLSLRQSMLVQRLARLYLMAYYGDKSRGVHVDIEQSRTEFSSALRELTNAVENTDASRRALELARMQWIFFDEALDGLRNGRNVNSGNVATTSERILEVLDEASVQYARTLASSGTR